MRDQTQLRKVSDRPDAAARGNVPVIDPACNLPPCQPDNLLIERCKTAADLILMYPVELGQHRIAPKGTVQNRVMINEHRRVMQTIGWYQPLIDHPRQWRESLLDHQQPCPPRDEPERQLILCPESTEARETRTDHMDTAFVRLPNVRGRQQTLINLIVCETRVPKRLTDVLVEIHHIFALELLKKQDPVPVLFAQLLTYKTRCCHEDSFTISRE